MIKRQPIPIISEKKEYKNQFCEWLYNSHYWVENKYGIMCCKWCAKIAPTLLNKAKICLKNPEILNIINRK